MITDPEDFAELALSLHDETTVVETVERVLEFALKAVNCTYAGVIFVHSGNRIETMAVTHPVVAEMDKIQFECGEGPDIDVLESNFSLIVGDTRTDERWPTWATKVNACGVRSLLNVRLYTSSETIGTLNLYDAEPDHFDHDDQAVAALLARHAAVALSTAQNNAHLWRAIDTRKLIGQAEGILMERFDLDEEQAFSVLLRYSHDKNIKLNKVAELLTTTRRLPG